MSVSDIFSGEVTLEVAMTLCGTCTPSLHKETVSGLMAALPVAPCYECAECSSQGTGVPLLSAYTPELLPIDVGSSTPFASMLKCSASAVY